MYMVKVSPAGKQDGSLWEEKGGVEVAQIFVSHYDDKVVALQFLFFENGKLVLSKRHGVDNLCENFNSVDLDYPSEFLTSISGSVQLTMNGDSFLSSISFGTNKGSYGPIGKASAAGNIYHFNYQIGNGRSIGGFHGSKCRYGIESIGVYVKTINIFNILQLREKKKW
ncbi:inactive protein RESTRICTED TEV MOVEMENT 1-like [Nicotiana tabacum]|uniref:Inactive protein RESTRICTED TEV MOVEMENT 1-like n=2 Tax=Nicotiana TaxID=4085 RepID=A0A1S4C9P4_TOBAC|nr:PREDICTED: inactive protein RESTRICTED TEV MOVEMENT 1-like [Nicotiana sylvestris]XP_016497855.1 PREDICTED: inactive protein RESTRICTED TEV MOVEMENT 1-like [Nicotiana tabacum]